MKEYVPFILDPLAGAVIGYVTNALAVKMLFRPLRPVYFLGLRIPMTPGVLPRQRKRLAESIGAMVEKELITPQVIAGRLKDESGEKLRSGAAAFFAGRARTAWPDLVTELVVFLSRPQIRSLLEKQGRMFLHRAVLNLNVFQRFFISAVNYDTAIDKHMPEIVADLLRELEELLRRTEIRDGTVNLAVDRAISALGPEKSGEETIAAALDLLDIKGLVRDRIDSLDMERVEGIILDLMAGELKWINLFGALIGALIGIFQALMNWFM